jgi:hypothetical protein
MPSMRLYAVALVSLSLLAGTCGGGGGDDGTGPGGSTGGTPVPGSLRALANGAAELSLLTGAGVSDRADEALPTGESVYAFDLATQDSRLISGGTPQVYAAQDENSKALGPFPATWSPFTGYDKTGDHSPKTDLPGMYAATIQIPEPGVWLFAAVVDSGSQRGVGLGHAVVSDDVVAPVGSKAISVKTPVATSGKALQEIDTRNPPSPLHYVSLDDALTNGKPTVVVFATPQLCESRLCGPIVDEVLLEYEQIGKERANFIHIEEFLPGPDLQPPAATFQNRAPAFKAWHLGTEPWVFVIDRNGVIRGRFGPGSITVTQIDAALQPLL